MCIIYKNSVYTSQGTQCATIRKTSQLGSIDGCLLYHTENMNTLCERNAEFLMLNLVE
jgi:hypothetical protein